MTGPAGEEDDLMKAGRRSYDDSVPAVVYIEEKLLRVFEEQLKETRHSLRQDITVLGAAVQTAALQSTQEHGKVQTQLAQITGILNEIPPLKTAVAALQSNAAADTGAADMSRTVWKAAGVVVGLLIATAGVVVAFF